MVFFYSVRTLAHLEQAELWMCPQPPAHEGKQNLSTAGMKKGPSYGGMKVEWGKLPLLLSLGLFPTANAETGDMV